MTCADCHLWRSARDEYNGERRWMAIARHKVPVWLESLMDDGAEWTGPNDGKSYAAFELKGE